MKKIGGIQPEIAQKCEVSLATLTEEFENLKVSGLTAALVATENSDYPHNQSSLTAIVSLLSLHIM